MKHAFAAALLALLALASPAGAAPHNIIVFVADGMRYGSVEPGNTPNLARLKKEGVDFTNSHSLFPTITTVNASAMTTGHYIGDTGNFGNSLWNGAAIVGLENDANLAALNGRFGGNYLNEASILARARAAGWSTAAIGKTGPARIWDVTAAPDGSETLLIDDGTGQENGFALPAWYSTELAKALVAPAMPRTSVPNIEQEASMMAATNRIVLPHFKAAGKPFIIMFWSRDPDGTQHATRDSIGAYDPGINGPTGLAGVHNADTMLGELRAALKAQGLDKTTDIFVTADHGFVTNADESATSPSAKGGHLGNGFLANDLAAGLKLKLTGSMLGDDPAHPDAIVVNNGGAALIYLPGANAMKLAGDAVSFLATQDYVSGLFVNDRLGKVPGALAMSDINMIGAARTPQPDILVNFRTFQGPCGNLQCVRGVYGGTIGQGSHGSFSRAETRNFMAATGPDFKAGFADPAPISNADIAPTLARIMGLDLDSGTSGSQGKLTGRVISEALKGGTLVKATRLVLASDPAPGGQRTYLDQQTVRQTRYFDAAGFAGHTVGLSAH